MRSQQVPYPTQYIFNSCNFDSNEVVTSRRLAPTREKPEGFSNETREMWWDLVEACTQTNPTDRPSIGSVVTTLCAISKMVLGMLIVPFYIFLSKV